MRIASATISAVTLLAAVWLPASAQAQSPGNFSTLSHRRDHLAAIVRFGDDAVGLVSMVGADGRPRPFDRHAMP